MPLLSFLGGVAVVLATAVDVFATVIVPRPTGRGLRPSAFISRAFWSLWRAAADRLVAPKRRESARGIFAPALLIALVGYWIVSIVVGYGLIFFALRHGVKPVPNLGEAIYLSGTSVLTIGFGDFVPVSPAARAVALLAGGSGLAAIAVVTAFLFPIFGAYQQREAFVVMFGNRAGRPPSAIRMLETHHGLSAPGGLAATMHECELWLARVLETHLAYPVLMYFRSTHRGISWIAVVGTILDMTALVTTTVDLPAKGEAIVLNRLALHFVDDVARYFRLPNDATTGIGRDDFDRVYETLRRAGVPVVDREAAWTGFSAARAAYAGRLDHLAAAWRVPKAEWNAELAP